MTPEELKYRTKECPRCKGKGSVVMKKKRSVNQNKYYWGVLVIIIATEIGEDTDTVHEILKYKFNSKKKILPDQSIVMIGISTTELDTKMFEQYLELCRNWSREFLNTYIPLPNEVTEEMMIEYEASYNSLFY